MRDVRGKVCVGLLSSESDWDVSDSVPGCRIEQDTNLK